MGTMLILLLVNKTLEVPQKNVFIGKRSKIVCCPLCPIANIKDINEFYTWVWKLFEHFNTQLLTQGLLTSSIHNFQTHLTAFTKWQTFSGSSVVCRAVDPKTKTHQQ